MTEQDEQQQLAGLEERYQWTRSQFESQMPTNRLATQGELQNAANYTLELVNWFRTNYGTTASTLKAEGFSALADRLNTILSDLQNAHNMYVSMSQPTQPPPPPPGPNPLDAMNHQNALFMASMLNQCWNCHMQFGAEEFLQLVYCPKCKAMLHE